MSIPSVPNGTSILPDENGLSNRNGFYHNGYNHNGGQSWSWCQLLQRVLRYFMVVIVCPFIFACILILTMNSGERLMNSENIRFASGVNSAADSEETTVKPQPPCILPQNLSLESIDELGLGFELHLRAVAAGEDEGKIEFNLVSISVESLESLCEEDVVKLIVYVIREFEGVYEDLSITWKDDSPRYFQAINVLLYKFVSFREWFLRYCIKIRQSREISKSFVDDIVPEFSTFAEKICGDAIKKVKSQRRSGKSREKTDLNESTRLALLNALRWSPPSKFLLYWGPTTANAGHASIIDYYQNTIVSHWPSHNPESLLDKIPSRTANLREDIDGEGSPPHEVILTSDWLLNKVPGSIPTTNTFSAFPLGLRKGETLGLLEKEHLDPLFHDYVNGMALYYDLKEIVEVLNTTTRYSPTEIYSLWSNCATEVQKYLVYQGYFTSMPWFKLTPWDVKEEVARTEVADIREQWKESKKDSRIRQRARDYVEFLLQVKLNPAKPDYIGLGLLLNTCLRIRDSIYYIVDIIFSVVFIVHMIMCRKVWMC